MKIQPVSCLKTQMQCETFTQKWKKKSLTWIGHKQKGLCPELKKIPYKGQKQILEGLEKTLPDHFQEVGYIESYGFIKMHY